MGHGTECVSVVGIARMVRQGLFNGPVSFRLSVPFIDRYSSAQRICSGGTHTRVLHQNGAQQHGVQQQMRAVSRCQLT